MKKTLETWKIEELIGEIERIEFPEFQREPTVWGLEKKKRLIDSILRGIDISLMYFAKNEEGMFDCIDGRQRINAILSYLGINPSDLDHNAFNLDMDNEIYDDHDKWIDVDSKRFERLDKKYKDRILNYKLNIMILEEPSHPEELNLMFLRLQLGSPLRGGEKLHAMSGSMRDFVFNELSNHDYFQRLAIPNRRYARELVATQILHNVFSHKQTGEFSRSRFEDLQSFFRGHTELGNSDAKLNQTVLRALSTVVKHMENKIQLIRNRGLAVSAFLFIWSELLGQNRENDIGKFGEFLEKLLGALRVQVEKAKRMEIDPAYRELLNLQTSLTQATGDTSSLNLRQEFFSEYFGHYLKTGVIKKNK
jgi:hypothetical protein